MKRKMKRKQQDFAVWLIDIVRYFTSRNVIFFEVTKSSPIYHETVLLMYILQQMRNNVFVITFQYYILKMNPPTVHLILRASSNVRM